tara:strand:- start:2579 stop:3253 length:675 start_codon:yes stop_codon:yes gene_type:complete
MSRLFSLTLLLFLSACEGVETPINLPFIGNYDLEYSMKNGVQVIDTVYQPVQSFTYQNQDGWQVTNKSYANKVWITEFFFTTCPTICPIMNVQMTNLAKEVRTMHMEDHVQFLSFSIDPTKDTPEALKKYKNLHCKDCKNWDFLTGDEEFTHRLGIESFKVFAGREEEAAGGYAHSGAFSMVDQNGFIRGVYNITDFDGSVNKSEYQRLLKELKILTESKIVTN